MSLDQKTQVQPADRVYEDFEPPHDWVHDQDLKREQMRVQISSSRILRLSGERQINENKWRKFHKEFPIPPEFDTSGISAKFEGGMLYVKLPKLITPIKPPPSSAQPDHQKPRIMDKAEKTTQPPPPTTPITPPQEPKADEDSQKKSRLVDKAEEAKAEKTKAPPLEELPKAVDHDSQKEKGKSVATTSKSTQRRSPDDGLCKGDQAKMEKRSQTMELLSRQTQEYKNALSGLVEGLNKQKKLVNLLVAIFLLLVLMIYVKNGIKSSFEGPKNHEL